MAYHDPFLLGPLGRMLELPSPDAGGLDAQYERIAGEHRSIRGFTTVDMLAVKRVWSFPLSHRLAEDSHALIARWAAPLTTETLRLVDPLVPNRLSLDVSTCGGSTSLAAEQYVSAGAQPTRIKPDTRPAALDGLLDGAYRWSPNTPARDWWLNLELPAPVTEGEQIVFRGWVRGASTSVEPFITELDAADDDTTTLIDSPIALSSTWQEFSVSVTVAAGTVCVLAGLHVESGSADRVVDLMGPQLGPSADLPAGKWCPGGGAPAVVVADFSHAYSRLGRSTMTIVVREQ